MLPKVKCERRMRGEKKRLNEQKSMLTLQHNENVQDKVINMYAFLKWFEILQLFRDKHMHFLGENEPIQNDIEMNDSNASIFFLPWVVFLGRVKICWYDNLYLEENLECVFFHSLDNGNEVIEHNFRAYCFVFCEGEGDGRQRDRERGEGEEERNY